MEELHGHTLEYWKNNAEEDYLKLPISVLKYITCLEERIEQLTIPVVSKCYTEKDMDNAYDKGFNDGNQRDLTGSLIEVL